MADGRSPEANPADPRLARPILRFAVTARRPRPVGYGEPADLTLATDGEVQPGELPAGETGDVALAYCLDLANQALIYTLADPAARVAMFDAPFLYAAQLEHARGALAVPYERVAELAPGGGGLHPIFVFSPGRVGSTLVTRLLGSIGRVSASEPDVFTRLAMMPAEQRRLLPAGIEPLLIRATVAALARQCGPDVVIKLRSQCNLYAHRMMQALPRARAVFLFRGPQDWVLSRHRSFARETPEIIAQILRQTVEAFDRLVKLGRAPMAVWYEDLIAHPQHVLLKILANSPLPVPAIQANLDRAMAADAQAGTRLARSNLQARDVDPAFVDAFTRRWREIAPKRLIARHGLDALA